MDWRSLGSLRRRAWTKSSCCCAAGEASASLGSGGRLLLGARGGKRLAALGIVAIDGHGLEAQLPRFDIGLHDVFDRGFLGHVDGLADGAGEEGLHGRHHLQMAAPGDGASAAGRSQRAIENRQMLGLEPGRAFDGAGAIDVRNDLRGFLGRISEVHQRLRNGVVDDLDDAAADQLLVFHQRQIGLDAGGVAIHHEADGAGGSEHGDLRILVAVLFAEGQRRVPGFARGGEQAGLHVFRLDGPQRSRGACE